MGDMKKEKEPQTLAEKAANREKQKNENVHNKNNTIDNLVKKAKGKDKPISARVNSETYIKFKKICEARGLTSNACLNMLISDFVIANKHIIE